VRSRKPAAGTASASVSRYDTRSEKYIATHRARYGNTEVARSRMLRGRLGRAYTASSFDQEIGVDWSGKAEYVRPARPLPGISRWLPSM